MNFKNLCLPTIVMFISTLVHAGGIITNSNQSASWVRMFARDASQEIDAVYYNPAGLTSLNDGLSISLNNQSVFSKKTIKNNYQYLNTHDYIGDISVPFFPSVYAAYKTGKFVFSAAFNPVGGGGKATFEDGLPSFELGISDLKPALLSKGVTDYSSNVYFKGSSVFYGGQFGISYKVNDIVSLFGGLRYVYACNTYEGYLKDNTLYFGTTPMSASTFFTSAAQQASATATNFAAQPPTNILSDAAADATGLPHGITYGAAAAALSQKSAAYSAKAILLSDQEVDVEQTGKGFTPIVGLNLNLLDSKLDIGLKYEFLTKLKLRNHTQKDITTGFTSTGAAITQFPNHAETASDMPALLSVGVSYKVLNNFKLSAGVHYYFDKNADYGRSFNGVIVENKDVISKNNYELALGMEYDLSDKFRLSAGYLLAKTGVMVGYNTDLSYALSSNSVGFGGKLAVSPRMDINLGMSYTAYTPSDKTYDHTIPTTTPQTVTLKESYYRDALIFSIGFDIKLGKIF
ncbi:MAG: outer membrane protein transport protein [Bacteroidota bacterium]|nr:outer membrane protein transport protein [Bacteroidota bacterium]